MIPSSKFHRFWVEFGSVLVCHSWQVNYEVRVSANRIVFSHVAKYFVPQIFWKHGNSAQRSPLHSFTHWYNSYIDKMIKGLTWCAQSFFQPIQMDHFYLCNCTNKARNKEYVHFASSAHVLAFGWPLSVHCTPLTAHFQHIHPFSTSFYGKMLIRMKTYSRYAFAIWIHYEFFPTFIIITFMNAILI